MKLNNRGVGSKEIFAVILIVCMILVVLVPVIINAVEFSNKKVLINNVVAFRNEVDKNLLSISASGKEVADGCYYIMNEGNVCLGDYDDSVNQCFSDVLRIELSGEIPKAGVIDISGGTVSGIHNVRISNFFVNINSARDYCVSEAPQAQPVCR